MSHFFRFPHTPHIAWLAPGSPRDDKVLSSVEASQLLAGRVVLEEKLDGANLGFSLAPDGRVRAQNRGQYLEPPYHGQFARLGAWLTAHEDALFDALGPDLMAFGEWCARAIRSTTAPCRTGGCCLISTTGRPALSGALRAVMPGRSRMLEWNRLGVVTTRNR